MSESDILSLNNELVVETNQSTTTRAFNGIIESVSLLSYEWVEVSELDNLLNDELVEKTNQLSTTVTANGMIEWWKKLNQLLLLRPRYKMKLEKMICCMA